MADEDQTAPASDTAPADENLLGAGSEQSAAPEAPAEDAAQAEGEDAAGGGDDLLNGKVGEEKTEAEEGDGEAAAPEDYEFTAPEGHELDAELVEQFKPVAKELGLSQEQAQKLVDHYAAEVLTKVGEKQASAWKQVQQAQAAEFKADPEFGGKNLSQSLSYVAKARDFAGQDVVDALTMHGAQNNPAVLKFLVKVGKGLAEDAPGFGAPAGRKSKDAAEILYPNN